MKTPRNIPRETIANQNKAADPKEFRLGFGQCRVGEDACTDRTRHSPAARRNRSLQDFLLDLYQGSSSGHAEPRFCAIVRLGNIG